MRIERVTDIVEIQRCLPFEQEIRDKGRDSGKVSDMLYSIKELVKNPMFGFWIAYDDDDNIKGYLSLLASNIPGIKRLVVLRLYAKTKELFDTFYEVGREFAKQYGIKSMAMTTSKSIKAYQRRHGWKAVSVNLEKEI